MDNSQDKYIEKLIIEHEKSIEEKHEETPSNNDITVEMLKMHFAKTRQRKYELPRVFSFLEQTVLKEYYVTPNFDIKEYEEFSKDFDKLLDVSSNEKTKNMIIEKYGLFGDKPKSYSDIAFKNNCSLNKIYSNINNAINMMKKNEYYFDKVKSYFNLKLKNDKLKEQEDIDFILNIVKELEGEIDND